MTVALKKEVRVTVRTEEKADSEQGKKWVYNSNGDLKNPRLKAALVSAFDYCHEKDFTLEKFSATELDGNISVEFNTSPTYT